MKICTRVLLFFLITTFSCTKQISKNDAKIYYERIKYDNIVPCYQLIMEQNKKLNEYAKIAIQKDPVKMSSVQINELENRQILIIESLNKAIEQIKSIEDLNDNVHLKDKSLSYLRTILNFETEAIQPSIEIFKNKISNKERKELSQKLSSVSKMKEASNNYKNTEHQFLNEFGITNEEVDELNKKYGF